MHSLPRSLCAFVISGSMATPVIAQSLPVLDRFSIGAGIFQNTLNIDGRIDGSSDIEGSQRDFDETLDFDHRREISMLEASALLGERHQIDARYYSDSRSRSVELQRDLTFNGEVFPAQASLRGRASFSVIELTYVYWMQAEADRAFGVQLGALRLQGELGLQGRIQIDDVGEVEGGSSVSERVYAPLLGLAVRRSLGEHWRLYGEARVIRLSYSGIDGDAVAGRVGIEYFPWDNLGLALQYGGSRLKAEQTKDDLSGELEVGFSGPQLLLRLRF